MTYATVRRGPATGHAAIRSGGPADSSERFAMTDALRARRSCMAVPGSNARFLEKAQALDADQVFLDIEDSVAPLAKPDARKNIVDVLNTGDWGTKIRVVRVNDWTTQWTYKDVIEVVEGAGANLD